MKFVLGLATTAAMAVTPGSAFTTNLSGASPRGNSQLAARVDSSDLVEEAMTLSKKYGPTSVEARLAWEAVEEVDANDNSVASMGSLNEECEVDAEIVPQECLEYGEALEELQDLIASTKPVAAGGNSVEPVKLSAPRGVAGVASPELQAALEEARTITAEKGLASPEARVAWVAVEEIAASGTSNALGGGLDPSNDECFAEEAAKDACVALEELNKVIGTPIANKIAAMLSTEEGTAEMRALWDDLDKDGDGKVSGKEWGSKVFAKKDIMSKYFGGSTLKEIGEAFNRIDSNGDDSLTWDEFRSEIGSYKAAQQMKDALATNEGRFKLKKLWNTLDKDKDGKITGKEWGSKVYANKEIMAKFFGGTDMASIGKGFNRIDINGDDLLTWEEFESSVNSN